MEGLFKLIIYLVILVFWVMSNVKKKNRWEDNIPDFPEDKTPPPPPKPQQLRPEGELSHAEMVQRSYEEKLFVQSLDLERVR